MEGIRIANYHAHVYYALETREDAIKLRDIVLKKNLSVKAGKMYDSTVEPHPGPMFQITFSPETFGSIVPFLSFNRNGLSILVHPNTGELIADHFERTTWMGKSLDLDIEYFVRFEK